MAASWEQSWVSSTQAKVSQGSLGKLLSAANTLQIRGLMEEDGEGKKVKEEFEIFKKPQPGGKTMKISKLKFSSRFQKITGRPLETTEGNFSTSREEEKIK